ncbi:hypothetical protein KFE17_00350 [Faecalicatena sp. Marseille-Q4148]|nr:hypothetical protein KFE17_00350 [Faecalicatena sp. Marseille-Q4148]
MSMDFLTIDCESNGQDVEIMIDIQTGVNYIRTGNGGVCPRYNADGTLVITPPDKLKELDNDAAEKLEKILKNSFPYNF